MTIYNMRYWKLFYLIFLISISCNSGKEHHEVIVNTVYYCDAETTLNDKLVNNDSIIFGSAKKTSKKYAYSGNTSLLLDSLNVYGFSLKLNDVVPGERFVVEAWQKTTRGNKIPALIIIESKNQFYHKQRELVSETKSGWMFTKSFYTIPENFEPAEVKFYIWNSAKKAIYVDDFKVTRIKSLIEYNKIALDKINLLVSQKNWYQLDSLANTAVETGRLHRSENDYVKTKIVLNNDTLKGKIRLKGDLTDHLKKDKWSFRLKTKKPLLYGLRKFNLQAPDTRWLLNEYVYHKIMEREGILCPKYQFVQVSINDKSWGIYALEEGLHQTMITQSIKQNGILLKFDDEPYWDRDPAESSEGYIKKSNIKTYGNSSEKDMATAIEILKKYQFQDTTYLDYFDLDLIARYYALNDVMRGYHAMGWINVRFFFNLNTRLMEPVGYDAYPGIGYMNWGHPYLGYEPHHKKYSPFESEAIIYSFFKNKKATQLYYSYLEKYTNPNKIKKWLTDLENDINFYEKQLQIEYPTYEYDRNFILNNAQLIRTAIDSNNP